MAVPTWQAQQQAKQAAAEKARAEALAFLHNKGEAVSETSKYSVFKGKATDEGIREKAPADNTLQLVAARRAQEKAAAAAADVPVVIPKVSLSSAAVHTNSTAKPKEDLPPGWTAVKDPASGKSYYYNAKTGKTQWDVPTAPKIQGGDAAEVDVSAVGAGNTSGAEKKELPAALKIKLQARGILKGAAEPAKPVLLPLGWYPATTPEGKTYYYTADGRRQWKVPTDPAAPSSIAPIVSSTPATVSTTATNESTATNDDMAEASTSGEVEGDGETADTTTITTTATSGAVPQQAHGAGGVLPPQGFPPGMMMPPSGAPDAAMQAYYFQYMMMMQAMANGQMPMPMPMQGMPMQGMPPQGSVQQPQTGASAPLPTNVTQMEAPKKQWDNKARYFKRSKGPESSAMDPLDPTGTGGRWSDGLEIPNIKKKATDGDAPAAAVRPSGGPLPSPGEILRMNAAAAATSGTAGQKRPVGASGGEERGEERSHSSKPKRPRGPG
jgi:hypothetical protein